jgi:ribosomal protein S18 acetylase RimI-like enzyme
MPLKLKLAQPENAPEVTRLVKAYRRELGAQGSDDVSAFVHAVLKSKYARVLVALSESKAIGFTIFTFSCSAFTLRRSIQITDVWVDEAFRGQGFASNMLKFIRTFAEKRGLSSIYLFTTTDGAMLPKFYTKRGFSEVGLRYFRNTITCEKYQPIRDAEK